MAKKSAAELKEEADAINDYVAKARKRPLNFALLVGKEGMVMEAHPMKGADVMRRDAKKRGGGAKGGQGVMNVSGKVIELTLEDDDAPRNLGKLAKKYFKELGLAFRVNLLLPGGETVGDEDDDDEEAGADAKKPGSNATDDGPADEAAQGDETQDDAEQAERDNLRKRVEELEKEVINAIGKVGDSANSMLETLKSAAEATVDGKIKDVQELVEDVAKKLEDAHKAAPVVNTDDLKKQLQGEFDDRKDDVERLIEADQKGVSKKAEQLAAMFSKEVENDLKKAGAILSLLKNFVAAELSKLEDVGNLTGDAVDSSSEAKNGQGGADSRVQNRKADRLGKLKDMQSSIANLMSTLKSAR